MITVCEVCKHYQTILIERGPCRAMDLYEMECALESPNLGTVDGCLNYERRADDEGRND